ncbi:MAG: thioredoxin domain-containing protein, partial [bacterium]|nr:thioredoxin domain-containing protein [bacterium]
MQENKFLVPLAIVVAGTLVAGAIYFGTGTSRVSSGNNNPGTDTKVEVAKVTDQDHILGERGAPVVIIEYSDLECPFCKVFHNTMKEVVRAYDGKVAWVYRHFPIAQLHSKAGKESEATECAAEQGGNTAFWSYTDEVYKRTNSNDSLDLAELPKIAADIGLDVNSFNTCLSSNKYAEQIERSVEEAIKAGARGTP